VDAVTGFLGLGAMGAPMAHNLCRAGVLAAVWNRSRPRLDAFLEDHPGVTACETPAAVAEHASVLLSCVSADADLLEVVDRLTTGMQPGAVLIDCSTVSRAAAVAAAERVAACGGTFLDAPVSGGVEGARAGSLAMMVGGDAAVLERVRPVLEAMAQRVTHMGPVGSGQATKAVNQIMAAGINQAVTEALAFAEAQGLPLDRVIEVVGAGAAGNWFLDHRGPSMVARRFQPGFRTALHHKDLLICRQMAQALGVALPVVEMTLIHYQRLMEAGFGDEDISTLYRHKRALFDSGDR
jgi:3-hydroxyisobutyrate dehydrogenase